MAIDRRTKQDPSHEVICLESFDAAGQIPKYALRGQEIIMVPTISGQPDELLWKHNGNKVVDFNGREEEVYGSFENRVTLHWTSAELKIVDLRYEDRGEYELEAFMNKRLHRSSHHLEVIDKVPQPSIACEMNNNGRGNTSGVQATLVCSAESKHPQFLKFMWRSGGVEQPGPNLTISLGGQHEEEEYSCEVSNPLSRGDATFNAKDCYPGFSSGTVALPVLVVIISTMCFLLAVLAYVFRSRLKACHKAKKGDLEGASPTPSGGSSDQEMCLLHSAATLPSKQQLQPLIQRDSEVESRDPDSKRTVSSDQEMRLLHSAATLASKQQLQPLIQRDSEVESRDPDSKRTGSSDQEMRLLHSAATLASKQQLQPLIQRDSEVESRDPDSKRTGSSDQEMRLLHSAATLPSKQQLQPLIQRDSEVESRDPDSKRTVSSDQEMRLLHSAATLASKQQLQPLIQRDSEVESRDPDSKRTGSSDQEMRLLHSAATLASKQQLQPLIQRDSEVESRDPDSKRTGSSDQEMRLLHSAATLPSKQQLQPLIQRDSEVESRDPDSKRTAKEMDLGDIRQKGIVNKRRQNFETHSKQTSSEIFSLNKRATGDDELPSSPNSPEQKEPQKTQPLESRERDDNQQERSSAVSADEEVSDGEGDQQVTEEEDVQSPAATQDSQTSTLRKADNGSEEVEDEDEGAKSSPTSDVTPAAVDLESQQVSDRATGETVRESHSPGDDELPSSPNSPEQKEPQKTQPLESRERDDNQQERSSAVSADEEVADGEGDQQVTEEEDVQSPAATQDSQTSTLRKADNGSEEVEDEDEGAKSSPTSDVTPAAVDLESQQVSDRATGETVRESHSPGDDELPSSPNSPEQKEPQKTQPLESRERDDNQQERSSAVSADEEVADGEGDQQVTEEEDVQSPAATQDSQTSTLRKADNGNTRTSQGSPDAAHGGPDPEGEGEDDSGVSDEQPGNSAEEEEDEVTVRRQTVSRVTSQSR
ncbi:uncharacterized protein ACBR49_006531 [Aulostomus maculatus]